MRHYYATFDMPATLFAPCRYYDTRRYYFIDYWLRAITMPWYAPLLRHDADTWCSHAMPIFSLSCWCCFAIDIYIMPIRCWLFIRRCWYFRWCCYFLIITFFRWCCWWCLCWCLIRCLRDDAAPWYFTFSLFSISPPIIFAAIAWCRFDVSSFTLLIFYFIIFRWWFFAADDAWYDADIFVYFDADIFTRCFSWYDDADYWLLRHADAMIFHDVRLYAAIFCLPLRLPYVIIWCSISLSRFSSFSLLMIIFFFFFTTPITSRHYDAISFWCHTRDVLMPIFITCLYFRYFDDALLLSCLLMPRCYYFDTFSIYFHFLILYFRQMMNSHVMVALFRSSSLNIIK